MKVIPYLRIRDLYITDEITDQCIVGVSLQKGSR